ncbi:hypothetical protein IQ238_15330 [Pleurocapsales cyanobacterium LEGE 06147]|nr:hypothetical protein [Pleurocapsales cyanobacterium LEGE 06147]
MNKYIFDRRKYCAYTMKRPLNFGKVETYFVITAFTIAGIVGWFGPDALQNWWGKQTVKHDKPIEASSKKNPSFFYKSLSGQDQEKVREYIQEHGIQDALRKYNSTLGK